MSTNRTLRLIASSMAITLSVCMAAKAETDTEIAAVTAANNAFYVAVSTLDAAAMAKVWAREPYINNIGPRSKSIAVGSVGVQDSYQTDVMAMLAQLTSKPVDTQIHVNGNVAWVTGKEASEGKTKDGSVFGGTNFFTSIFEKVDGRWLMVSHHAHRMPL